MDLGVFIKFLTNYKVTKTKSLQNAKCFKMMYLKKIKFAVREMRIGKDI